MRDRHARSADYAAILTAVLPLVRCKDGLFRDTVKEEAMSMTREEAIREIETVKQCEVDTRKQIQALDMALAALRPITREQVERVWRGCSWCNNEGKKPENWECSLLDDRGFSVVVGDEVVWTNAEFCPVCGKPLTDEAVEMVMERMEKIK